MSERKVSIVRRIFDAWGANDPDTALELLDDGIEWHPAQDEPESGTIHGKEELQGMLLKWLTAFDDFRVEPLEFIDAGDAVVIPLHLRGKLPGSGVEVTNEETMVYWLRGDKVVEVREYRTKDEALAVAEITTEGRDE
jgi:ketosteroid isomerase-like protein